jgi:hypothetical protein
VVASNSMLFVFETKGALVDDLGRASLGVMSFGAIPASTNIVRSGDRMTYFATDHGLVTRESPLAQDRVMNYDKHVAIHIETTDGVEDVFTTRSVGYIDVFKVGCCRFLHTDHALTGMTRLSCGYIAAATATGVGLCKQPYGISPVTYLELVAGTFSGPSPLNAVGPLLGVAGNMFLVADDKGVSLVDPILKTIVPVLSLPRVMDMTFTGKDLLLTLPDRVIHWSGHGFIPVSHLEHPLITVDEIMAYVECNHKELNGHRLADYVHFMNVRVRPVIEDWIKETRVTERACFVAIYEGSGTGTHSDKEVVRLRLLTGPTGGHYGLRPIRTRIAGYLVAGFRNVLC